ncbi:MAG: ATP-dependent sacrificial sulfur transferase LarE [Chitinispirillaceae bacterium]|nr:ATP-dependent sacrificial sulfur transferase LarE [Chitinispirillaceae bacterium]
MEKNIEPQKKLENLKEIIGKYKSAVVAFSGGVDSTFLAKVTTDVLGSNVLLITATSSTYPESEKEEAEKIATQLGAKHIVIVSEEIEIPEFVENSPNRCYYCKYELFSKLLKIASEKGYSAVLEGSTIDDLSDFRPGRKAIKELGIHSPLIEANLTKNEIRLLSKMFSLPTADKPSYACLASRFPYGEPITKEKLERVGKAEEELKKLGFRQFRVRSHNELARIEVEKTELEKAWQKREEIDKICRKAGFTYVTLDLRGYRTGSMNETLNIITLQ